MWKFRAHIKRPTYCESGHATPSEVRELNGPGVEPGYQQPYGFVSSRLNGAWGGKWRWGRYHAGRGGVIKRKCGIHEDLETLLRATSSRWSISTIPGWTRYSMYDGFGAFPCISWFIPRFSRPPRKPGARCYLKEELHSLRHLGSELCAVNVVLVLPPGQGSNLGNR